jgi:hypothetical protein
MTLRRSAAELYVGVNDNEIKSVGVKFRLGAELLAPAPATR